MNESLEVIVEVIAIVSFVATIVNYTIIKPLKISIDTLAIAVDKLESAYKYFGLPNPDTKQ